MLLVGNDEGADSLGNESDLAVVVVRVSELVDILDFWVLLQHLLDLSIVLALPLHFLSSVHNLLLGHVSGD